MKCFHRPKCLPGLLLGILFLIQFHLAAEEIVVVVNKSNEVSHLTRSQVIDLFMGKYVAFPDGTKAQPLDSEDTHKAQFYQKLVGMPLARVNAYWSRIKFTGRARPPISKNSSTDIITYIEQNENAIGYIPLSKLNTKLKVVFQLK